PLAHITDALATIGKQAFLGHDPGTIELEAYQLPGCQGAEQQVPLPLGNQPAAVERHSAQSRRSRPPVMRCHHAGDFEPDRAGYRFAVVVPSCGRDRPPVVPAGLPEVELVTTHRTVLAGPELPRFRVQR